LSRGNHFIHSNNLLAFTLNSFQIHLKFQEVIFKKISFEGFEVISGGKFAVCTLATPQGLFTTSSYSCQELCSIRMRRFRALRSMGNVGFVSCKRSCKRRQCFRPSMHEETILNKRLDKVVAGGGYQMVHEAITRSQSYSF